MTEDMAGTEQNISQAAAPAQTAAPAPGNNDPFGGVSREGMIHKYRELEGKFNQLNEQSTQLGDFVRKVGPFFKVDGESVYLNEDMVKHYAEQHGWLQHAAQDGPTSNQIQGQNQNQNNNGGAPEEGFMDRLEKNGDSTIREMIREELANGLKENVFPQFNKLWKFQGEGWVERLKARYPDFENWRNDTLKVAEKLKLSLDSFESMEQAYKIAKTLGDGFVDKKTHEALQQDYNKTMQVVNPGGGGFNQRALNLDADPEDLLGFTSIQNNPQGETLNALFSKNVLKP